MTGKPLYVQYIRVVKLDYTVFKLIRVIGRKLLPEFKRTLILNHSPNIIDKDLVKLDFIRNFKKKPILKKPFLSIGEILRAKLLPEELDIRIVRRCFITLLIHKYIHARARCPHLSKSFLTNGI